MNPYQENQINNATVSIIVPCYNQAQYLSETLQSVLEQEYADWECIIVNDGSPDNTDEIAKLWLQKDTRFKYLLKENEGVSIARNYAIARSTGKYILPLDGDDLILPSYIRKAVEILENDTEVKLVYPKVRLFGAKNGTFDLPPYSYNRLLLENLIINAGVFRRSDFLKTAGYDSSMVWGCEDWDFWLTFLTPFDKVVRLDEYLFLYRIKEQSRNADIQKENERKEKIYWQLFKNHEPLYLSQESYIACRLERDRILHSRQYRLGCLLFAPLSRIRRFLKRKL
ncbi:MAG: glycosyltransferase family 2 protein [Prevotella sp.]|jgi:glycosyltransferase involved in cell wall biosynthesis|nr:glycosyltransferase family 2 protein [Prevotella sp.]